MNSIRLPPNSNGESSCTSVQQPQKRWLDTGPCESIQEFLQRLFDERDLDEVPLTSHQDGLSKKIKLEVVDLSRQCDARAFPD